MRGRVEFGDGRDPLELDLDDFMVEILDSGVLYIEGAEMKWWYAPGAWTSYTEYAGDMLRIREAVDRLRRLYE